MTCLILGKYFPQISVTEIEIVTNIYMCLTRFKAIQVLESLKCKLIILKCIITNIIYECFTIEVLQHNYE